MKPKIYREMFFKNGRLINENKFLLKIISDFEKMILTDTPITQSRMQGYVKDLRKKWDNIFLSIELINKSDKLWEDNFSDIGIKAITDKNKIKIKKKSFLDRLFGR